MVTGVSASMPVAQPAQTSAPAAASAEPSSPRTGPDTVSISAAGRQASADVDHDGDGR